ncbi:unnamed protein product [Heterobilharzia americana]|nr:unnamed protein product [Heterobilharzia americana]
MNQVLSGILKFTQIGKETFLNQLKLLNENSNAIAAVITCVDSRVAPSKFLCSNVGELFIERNPGNFVCCENYTSSHFNKISVTPGFLEMTLIRCKINDLIICGHSDCRAMGVLNSFRNYMDGHVQHNNSNGADVIEPSPLENWIWENGKKTLQSFNLKSDIISFSSTIHPKCPTLELDIRKIKSLPEIDKLSQVNVLQQMINVYSYQTLISQITQRSLRVHGLWFALHSGDVHLYSRLNKEFIPISQEKIPSLLDEMK